jgi:RNA polymerase sigma-70 factor, ECF subfamily
MPDGDPSDAEVVRCVLLGDVDRFEVIVSRYRSVVFELLSRRLPAAEVPVVASDVFVSAWESLERYEARAPFAGWLTRLALRRCHDHWRRTYAESALRERLDDAAWRQIADAAPPRAARRRDDAEQLQLLLGRLPPDDRAVLTLLHLDERPVAEVAEILGWSTDKVKTRAHRVRRRLREAAAPDNAAPEAGAGSARP